MPADELLTPPLMTVVLVTPARYEALGETLDCLAAQEIAGRLELVVVAPTTSGLGPEPPQRNAFHRWTLVETGPFRSTGHAVSAGVRHASAPIVVYVEEHVAPEPGWAEAIVEAFDGRWAAVGPALINANPGSRTSWAALVQDYGPWLDPVESGERDRLPVHQAAFDRTVLLGLGGELESMFESENLLEELRSRGYRFYLEAGARARHLNVSRPGAYAWAEFLGGRLYATGRVRRERWSAGSRALYAVAAPAVVIVRLRRRASDLRRIRRTVRLPAGVSFFLLLGVLSHSAGETVGCLLGAGDAARRRLPIETDRRTHLHAADRLESRRAVSLGVGRSE